MSLAPQPRLDHTHRLAAAVPEHVADPETDSARSRVRPSHLSVIFAELDE
jgi:hypothetical protein